MSFHCCLAVHPKAVAYDKCKFLGIVSFVATERSVGVTDGDDVQLSMSGHFRRKYARIQKELNYSDLPGRIHPVIARHTPEIMCIIKSLKSEIRFRPECRFSGGDRVSKFAA